MRFIMLIQILIVFTFVTSVVTTSKEMRREIVKSAIGDESFYMWLFANKFQKGEVPKFRILAPEFVCPKDEDAAIVKPDNTIITLQTAAGSTFDIVWTVRWVPIEAPSQRLTLLIWRAVRALEAKLNAPQPEPFVYVIPNEELLNGINYEFNITAVEENGKPSSSKTFYIDNTKGDTKLDLVEGRADLLYVVLVGSQATYADIEYVLEALLTSCFHTQDYYFNWIVRTSESDVVLDVTTTGARLILPPNTLSPWLTYDADCQVIKYSNGWRLTQIGLPFQVLYRGLKVYLNVDYLIVPIDQPFLIEPIVVNPDYYDSSSVYIWECTSEATACDDFYDSTANNSLVFPNGISTLGDYQIKLTVTVQDQTSEANAFIKAVENNLPVIQISPLPRLLNEGSVLHLVANASNVAPTCNLTWFFAAEGAIGAGGLNQSEHGDPLIDTLTVFSLEENFLNELADFTNGTEYREVVADIDAAAGRARFVAECGCSVTFACETQGMVYGELNFKLNEAPKAGRVKVSPETGTAMETVFRISTLAAIDQDTPLKYNFYCRIGNDEAIVLGSYIDYLAVETLLPYIDGGTEVWVEICDSLGACSSGDPTTLVLDIGEGNTTDMQIEDFRGRTRRCEMLEAQNAVKAAIVSYKSAEQAELLSSFSAKVLEALPPDPQCTEANAEQYTAFLHWLAKQGVDTSAVQLST